jgi:osmotically-inducible protein OsmY
MRRAFAFVLFTLVACAGNIDPSRQLDDAALATSVRDAIRNDAALRSSSIQVDVQRGVVTLTGRVRTNELRARATTVVRSVANVKDVSNLLTTE